MIPILYEKTETAFISNGLCRLRDTISAIVLEERNGVYELNFEYPVDGANYDMIQIGRIVGVTHDESLDIQPFDIVGFEKPIDGVVTFHCVHISYRQSYFTVNGSNINSLSDALTRLKNNATPSNPFTYWTDKTSLGYVGVFDGVPKTVRQILGGIEGSILDAYGGEYEWDKWAVKLWSARGQRRDFSIRYGVNMLDYNEDYDASGCYSACIPYWTDGTTTIVGDKQTSGGTPPSGREQCIPLDVSEKFEDQPTKSDVNSAGLAMMKQSKPTVPSQNIEVSFVRLQDMGEFADYQNLLQCKLCDTINVIFPDFNSSGTFKIVKTEWNVLKSKYESMELGDLSITLSEALGINDVQQSSKTTIEQMEKNIGFEDGSSSPWYWRKYNNGTFEAWRVSDSGSTGALTQIGTSGTYYSSASEVTFPSIGITSVRSCEVTVAPESNYIMGAFINRLTNSSVYVGYMRWGASSSVSNIHWRLHITGTWA